MDVSAALAGARLAMAPDAFDAGDLVHSRERHRVCGDHLLTYLDQLIGRTYPDTIGWGVSDYDTHGYPTHPFFALIPHDATTLVANHPAPGGTCFIPYRCCLPEGIEGLLVGGIGISMERDATAMVRMQYDVTNQGYALGLVAAAARGDLPLRDVDIRSVQQELVRIGNLPPEILDHDGPFPLPAAAVATAVDDLQAYCDPEARPCTVRALAIVLRSPERSLPLLREAHNHTRDSQTRLALARILGVRGEPSVGSELAEALAAAGDWDAKILQGRMAEYAHLPTPIDALIVALAGTGSEGAIGPILQRLESLDATVTLSHHRSVALALETLGRPPAAKPLADLLAKPGMRGHVMRAIEARVDKPEAKRRREGSLREIVLARALYRCGDWQGAGREILVEYTADRRGLFARHAQWVLGENNELDANCAT